MSSPWSEKYRPSTLTQVVHQQHVVAALQQIIKTKIFPHLLFYGPPGTGKTSTILAVCRDLFQGSFSQRVLELNASDERGIGTVRSTVKSFSRTTVSQSGPPFKVIILDEADAMTSDAQAALRRIMESHAKVTRFCLICNYVSRIIEPLASRCAKFRFKPISISFIEVHLLKIATQENLQVDDNTIKSISINCEGDLRKGITLLQSHSYLQNFKQEQNFSVEEIIRECQSGDSEGVMKIYKQIIRNGLCISDLLNSMLNYYLNYNDEIIIAKVISKIASIEGKLLEGADENMQLLDLLFTCSSLN
eukprot:TRINITY_DN397_c1_g1_i5.p1 TRINITY_DN397_c1_g1~~TRINITY_DN397_c1_g1_i5.p1  ORF type:complete len:305 (-),score=109.32 TRINITY_DN397_c1_g1_i5:60-974(-)